MLLATYQPLAEHDNHALRPNTYSCFMGVVDDGKYPLFCFPARSADEFVFRSLLSAPRKPERLLFFETEDYEKFDAVEWNRIKNMPRDSRIFWQRFNNMFQNPDDHFAEYVISSGRMDEAVAEVNIMNFMTSKAPFFGDDESNKIFRTLQSQAQNMARGGILGDGPVKPDTDVSAIVTLTAFVTYLGAIAWGGASGNMPSTINCIPYIPDTKNTGAIEKWKYYCELRHKIFDECRGTHAEYMEMADAFSSAVSGTRLSFLSDIGRNNPCPCGSGKKFKKCHGLHPVNIFPFEDSKEGFSVIGEEESHA